MQDEAESPGGAASVRGRHIPKRRFTRWALYYVLLYVCLPVLLIGALLDGLLYLVSAGLFDRCYALFCLLS